MQAPTGLVRDDSGESSTVRRDATLTPEPRADEVDAALPIVLVGARDTPVEVVAADARSLRERCAPWSTTGCRTCATARSPG